MWPSQRIRGLSFPSGALACVLGLVSTSIMNGQSQRQSLQATLDAQPSFAKAAAALWASALTKCGDSFFFVRRYRGEEPRLIELKAPVDFGLQEDTLSRADQLNGIQAQGTTVLDASASRWIDNGVGSAGIPAHKPQWSEWGGGVIPGHDILTALSVMGSRLQISMTRKSGHWEFSGEIVDSLSEEALSHKFTCEAAAYANPLAASDAFRPGGKQQLPTSSTPRVGQFMCPGAVLRDPRSEKDYTVDRPRQILRILHVGDAVFVDLTDDTKTGRYEAPRYAIKRDLPRDSCAAK
jgi:hypothetical protein